MGARQLQRCLELEELILAHEARGFFIEFGDDTVNFEKKHSGCKCAEHEGRMHKNWWRGGEERGDCTREEEHR